MEAMNEDPTPDRLKKLAERRKALAESLAQAETSPLTIGDAVFEAGATAGEQILDGIKRKLESRAASAPSEEGTPEPSSDTAQVRPDPRQPAYDAVYENIRSLGEYLPPDTVHRNAIIWRAVQVALDATPVGRCMSSHCVEGDHFIGLGGPDA
ncbi:hypothetical protein [Streptomyces sp. SM13]|uniref:hypothetical protein n=1 Tax=Streptomyces sp. SM13 TaxID=1983803 RepID=UPI0011B07E8D|nr:hypothetical protein [Streptomyces sp. SM13]